MNFYQLGATLVKFTNVKFGYIKLDAHSCGDLIAAVGFIWNYGLVSAWLLNVKIVEF